MCYHLLRQRCGCPAWRMSTPALNPDMSVEEQQPKHRSSIIHSSRRQTISASGGSFFVLSFLSKPTSRMPQLNDKTMAACSKHDGVICAAEEERCSRNVNDVYHYRFYFIATLFSTHSHGFRFTSILIGRQKDGSGALLTLSLSAVGTVPSQQPAPHVNLVHIPTGPGTSTLSSVLISHQSSIHNTVFIMTA